MRCLGCTRTRWGCEAPALRGQRVRRRHPAGMRLRCSAGPCVPLLAQARLLEEVVSANAAAAAAKQAAEALAAELEQVRACAWWLWHASSMRACSLLLPSSCCCPVAGLELASSAVL